MRKMLLLLSTVLVVSLTACAGEIEQYRLASVSDTEVQEMTPQVLEYLDDLRAWKFSNIGLTLSMFDDTPASTTDFEAEHLTDLPVDDSLPRDDHLNHVDTYSFRVFDVSSDPTRTWMYFHAGKLVSRKLVSQSGVMITLDGRCEPHFWLLDQQSVCGALSKEQWAELSTKAIALSRTLRGTR